MTSDSFTPPHPLNTAVLFLVFNRLDTTKQVFEAIREAKPPRLYIAADGARETKEGEAEKVTAVRDFILQNIDWECDIKTLFREENLGCKYAVSGAIDWFFDNEEMGIILEDDCLPSQSFFWFCEELLEKYKDDQRVGQISGFNYGYSNEKLKYDYFFSKYGFIWGWASWARAWKFYDVNMSNYEEINGLDMFRNYFSYNIDSQKRKFTKTKNGEIDTWDYQWSYARFINNLYTIVPKNNCIKNIGFDKDATHTTGPDPYSNVMVTERKFCELKHPTYVIQIHDFYRIFENRNNIVKKLMNWIKA